MIQLFVERTHFQGPSFTEVDLAYTLLSAYFHFLPEVCTYTHSDVDFQRAKSNPLNPIYK